MQYPAVNVYCEKIVNYLTEKFRTFSGQRADGDRGAAFAGPAGGAAGRVWNCTRTRLTQVLNSSRGDWGDGMFYAGGYEVAFGAVKQGGKNFIQVAKITFEIGVSRN